LTALRHGWTQAPRGPLIDQRRSVVPPD